MVNIRIVNDDDIFRAIRHDNKKPDKSRAIPATAGISAVTIKTPAQGRILHKGEKQVRQYPQRRYHNRRQQQQQVLFDTRSQHDRRQQSRPGDHTQHGIDEIV